MITILKPGQIYLSYIEQNQGPPKWGMFIPVKYVRFKEWNKDVYFYAWKHWRINSNGTTEFIEDKGSCLYDRKFTEFHSSVNGKLVFDVIFGTI